jgi:hypothetical protein
MTFVSNASWNYSFRHPRCARMTEGDACPEACIPKGYSSLFRRCRSQPYGSRTQGIALHGKENMMVNVVSGTTYSTASTTQSTPAVENKPAAGSASSSASSATTAATASSKPIISYQGTILSSLFDAADEFIQKEHLIPYPGCRYSNASYVDIERYNNYLFDKAATTLIAQAKEKGIELDKKDVLTQLKENNAEIAALKFDYVGRLDDLSGPIRASSTPKSSATDGLSANAKAWLESEARFDRYRHRINSYACNFFTRGDRKVIGEAYEIAENLNRDMTKIDKLVNELAAFRIRQHMQGELVMLAVKHVRAQQGEEDPDAPYQVDLAHLPLLGKIREMAGPGD